MQKFLPLLFLCLPIYGDDYAWAKQELALLRDGYRAYLAASPRKRAGMDVTLADLRPAVDSFTLSSGEMRHVPFLQFFTLVDPITGESSASAEEKQEAAARDLGSIEAFITMNNALDAQKDSKTTLFKLLTLMKTWADEASLPKTSQSQRQRLSQSFSHMVSEIGRRPEFGSFVPVYRTRRAFRLETPEMAASEAEILKNILAGLA